MAVDDREAESAGHAEDPAVACDRLSSKAAVPVLNGALHAGENGSRGILANGRVEGRGAIGKLDSLIAEIPSADYPYHASAAVTGVAVDVTDSEFGRGLHLMWSDLQHWYELREEDEAPTDVAFAARGSRPEQEARGRRPETAAVLRKGELQTAV